MLFTSFKYHISPSFPSTRIEELRHVLDHNGATEAGVGGEGGEGSVREAWLKEVNLVVSNSMKFEGWEDVKERNEGRKLHVGGGGEKEEEPGEVYVVTDKWVDRSLVLGKIQSPHHYSADPSLIFSGIIACATSLPPSDLEVLSAGITALGGQWRTGLTKDVTHLFAMSPDSQKYATAMHFREETGVKVILPHWFDDVVRLGMGGLSTDVYEWPDPELLKNPLGVGGGGGGQESGVKKNMYAMAALFTAPMHESSSPPIKDLEMVAAAGSRMNIWKGKKIILSRTLQLSGGRREAVQVGIERAGGVVVRYGGDEEMDEGEMSKREKETRQHEAEKVLDSDVLVTRWRDGAAYVAALRSRKTIGTLPWLFHVQSTGTLTPPLDQLLHYPVPKRPIEAFSNHVITVTNYTGEAREYLKKLIIAMGAKFTPSMSGQNTVLIAAYISGTKSTKAQSWSIPIVNHTWLEDCFIQWRNLTVGLEKYIGFPNGVDFSKLLGVRGVGALVMEEALEGGEGEAEGGGEVPRGTDASVKEVQGLIDMDMTDVQQQARGEDDGGVMMDVDREDEGQKTPTKKTHMTKASATSEERVNGQGTPVPIPVSPRISPNKKAIAEPGDSGEEENETNGRERRKTKHWIFSPEDDNDNEQAERESKKKPTRTQKPTQTQSSIKKKKTANRLPSFSEGEVEVLSATIAKTGLDAKGKKAAATLKHSKRETGLDDDDMDVDEEEEEVVSSKVIKLKTSAKGKTKINSKEGLRPAKSKFMAEDDDDDDMDEDKLEEGEEEEEEERPKAVGRKYKVVDDDAEEEEEEYQNSCVKSKSKSNPPSPIKYTSPTKPTVSAKPKTKPPAPAPEPIVSELESDDELGLAMTPPPPPRARNSKLIRRVSGVVPDVVDKRMSSDDDEQWEEEEEKGREKNRRKEEEQQKTKPRLSLIEKNQAKKGDARTRVRKRKVEVPDVEVESDEGEDELQVLRRSTLKGKTKVVNVKRGSASALATVKTKEKGKTKSRIHHEDEEEEVDDEGEDGEEEEEEEKLQPSRSTMKMKKSIKQSMNAKPAKRSISKKFASPSDSDNGDDDDDVQTVEDLDSDSDLPAAPLLSFTNGKVGSTSKSTTKSKKQAASMPASASASVTKAKAKSKTKTRTAVESEDEDQDDMTGGGGGAVSTLRRPVSVLMPSFHLSGNKNNGVSAKDGKKTKKVKLSVSSAEDEEEEEEEAEGAERSVLVSPRRRGGLTRTESIRVVSGHQVQVSARKNPGATTAVTTPTSGSVVVKRNSNAVATSSGSKSKSKSALTDLDLPPLPPANRKSISSSPKKPSSPVLNKRSAATKATQRLHDTIMPDLVHFESQMRRSKGRKSGGGGGGGGGGLAAFKMKIENERGWSVGKRSQDDEEMEEERGKKRRKVDDLGGSVSVGGKGKGKVRKEEDESEEEEEEEEEEDRVKKRSLTKGKGKGTVIIDMDDDSDDNDDNVASKIGVGAKARRQKEKETEKPSRPGVMLLTTQVTLSDEVIRTLTKLGVKMTSRPSECTHLLAPQLVRTEKFLCALVVAPFILTEKWAVQSAAVKKLLPEKSFALQDISGENKYGIDLMQSLRRAKELGGKLLSGQIFYVTPKVPVDTKLLKNVVSACGGQITTQQPTARIINASPQNRHVISCKEDIAIWRSIAAQGIPIYSQELLLTGVLKQEIEWDRDEVRVDV